MDLILLGFETLLNPMVLGYLFLGVLAGLIIGAIPGLNENIAFAVFLPFSFVLDPANALALMVGVYCSAAVGGAIPAIMIRVPGTASAVLTSIDGNAMAKDGHASKALGIAVFSSVFGGISSSLVLLFFAPVLAGFALRFGYVENFALCLLGIAAVLGMMERNLLKGLLSALLGLLIATSGFSLVTGYPRFTFGTPNLFEGAPFVPMLVGLFGIAAVFELSEEIYHSRRKKEDVPEIPRIDGPLIPSRAMMRRLLPTWLSASVIGNVVGVLPGAGMIMAIYLAYNHAANRFSRRFAGKPGEVEWTKGAPEGIAAPEASNNAVVASSMVPLLSLGIPGNSVSALFIGALMIHGMVPGPLLFINNADIAWMIICAFLAANLMMAPVAIFVIRYISGYVYRIPKVLLVPTITLLCLSGAYADANSIFNIWVALAFGVLGYALNKFNVPTAPLILALVLGKQLEDSLANSLSVSGNDWLIFFNPVEHPISLGLMLGAIFFALLPGARAILNRRRAA